MQWIKTSERLPDVGIQLIFYSPIYQGWTAGSLNYNFYDKLVFIDTDSYRAIYAIDEVSHWMIPELPEDL